jgi:DNA-binding IclR family transcriptional regulator
MNPSTSQRNLTPEAHMHHPDDEELIQQIQPVLELDHQYTRHVEASNEDLVAQIRRCGRAAGRRLEYKVRTFASDPRDRDDRRIVVWVVVTASNPDDEHRIHQRAELLIHNTLNQLLS